MRRLLSWRVQEKRGCSGLLDEDVVGLGDCGEYLGDCADDDVVWVVVCVDDEVGGVAEVVVVCGDSSEFDVSSVCAELVSEVAFELAGGDFSVGVRSFHFDC